MVKGGVDQDQAGIGVVQAQLHQDQEQRNHDDDGGHGVADHAEPLHGSLASKFEPAQGEGRRGRDQQRQHRRRSRHQQAVRHPDEEIGPAQSQAVAGEVQAPGQGVSQIQGQEVLGVPEGGEHDPEKREENRQGHDQRQKRQHAGAPPPGGGGGRDRPSGARAEDSSVTCAHQVLRDSVANELHPRAASAIRPAAKIETPTTAALPVSRALNSWV